jgi:WD40 repeat protein
LQSSAVEYLRFPRSFSFHGVVVPARGEWFASADNAGTVMFWRLSHGMAQPLPYKARIKDDTFSHDERLVAAVEAAGRINVFATNNATAKASMQLPASTGLRNPKFSPDDSLFAVLDENVLRVISTSKWQLMPERTVKATADGHDMSFFFTGNNGDLVVAEPGLVRRFRLTPWTQLPSFAPGRTAAAYVSADRRWMAFLEPGQKTAGMSRFLDADSGKLVAPAQIPQLRGIDAEHHTPSEAVRSADSLWVRLPDSQNRLSGEGDGGEWWTLVASDIGTTADLEISERRTGHTVARLVHDDVVHSVAISSQGNWIATASGDRDIFLWPWSQEGLIKLTCARLPRNLTRQEWKSKNLEAIGFGPYQRTCPNLPWPAGDSAKADVR